MPVGSYTIIPVIMREIIKKDPKYILDYGMGNGIYGALIRNYLDIYQMLEVDRLGGKIMGDFVTIIGTDFDEKPPDTEEDINVVHEDSYDKVFWKQIPVVMLNDLNTGNSIHYNCILCLEVIEHLGDSHVRLLIEKLIGALEPGGILLIATSGDSRTSSENRAPHRHISHWPVPKLKHIVPGIEILVDGQHVNEFGHKITVAKFTKPQ